MTTDEFEKWASRNGQWMLDHATRVRFVIESNGQVTGIVEERGSGNTPFDAAALDALEEVILPPLPSNFPRDRETVHALFVGKGPVRAMRVNLSKLKRAGYF